MCKLYETMITIRDFMSSLYDGKWWNREIMYSRKLKVSKVCIWTIYGSSSYILHIINAFDITCTVESHVEPLSLIITTIQANSIP